MGASSRCRLFIRIFSFERTNSQGTAGFRQGGSREVFAHGLPYAKSRRQRLVFAQDLQKCGRRSKKQVPRHGSTEVEEAVVVAGGSANEHILNHLLDRPG